MTKNEQVHKQKEKKKREKGERRKKWKVDNKKLGNSLILMSFLSEREQFGGVDQE